MKRVVIPSFSTYYDRETRLQFEKTLDRRSGCFVGVACVSDSVAAAFAGRAAFRVIDDAEWDAMTRPPVVHEPEESVTGDPLFDAAVKAAPAAPGAPAPIPVTVPPKEIPALVALPEPEAARTPAEERSSAILPPPPPPSADGGRKGTKGGR